MPECVESACGAMLSRPGTIRASCRLRICRREPVLRLAPMCFALLCCMAAGGLLGETGMVRKFESGPVQATITLEPSQPVIGDAITLSILVRAEKNVEVLMPEFGEALERFAIVDFVPRESVDDQGRTILEQRYRLQPATSGRQTVPPILVEYVDRRPGQRSAPEGLDAYELMTDRIEFQVQSVLPPDAESDLKPALGELPPLAPPPAPTWPWLVGGIVVLAITSPMLIRAWNSWQRRSRRQSAYQVARSRLDRLLTRPRLTPEQIDEFYVELSGIVRRYLEDRFELRAPELTTEEFLAAVGNSADLSRDHQSLLREFLRQADLVKFAGLRPDGEVVEQSISAAGRFLDETRENSPLVDVEAHLNGTP